MKKLLAVLALPLLLGPVEAEPDMSAAHIRADMAFLASDKLKGREAGTPEFDIAADYVAGQMKAIGLTPLGSKNSYFQPVPLLAYRTRDQGALTLHGASAPGLQFGTDSLVGGDPLAALVDVDAPLVFVGYGLVAPGRDDYRGLDVKGKIVVALSGAPKFLQTEERAYYRSGKVKLAQALARDALRPGGGLFSYAF